MCKQTQYSPCLEEAGLVEQVDKIMCAAEDYLKQRKWISTCCKIQCLFHAVITPTKQNWLVEAPESP